MPIIQKHLPNAKIILYGSRARQTNAPGADIDIALDMGKKIDRSIIIAIKDDLEESALPILFDVVDYHAVSEHMRNEIKRDGKVWNL